jgi:hypothetical protein
MLWFDTVNVSVSVEVVVDWVHGGLVYDGW